VTIRDLAQGPWTEIKYLPCAFTERGAIMVASILNSSRAVQMSVNVVRAFVKLRQVLVSQAELARKPDALEASLVSLDSETRRQFEDVYAAVRALMASPQPSSRPIGLTADLKGPTE
jgi:hypothetical protein